MKVKPQVSNIKCEVKQLDFFKERKKTKKKKRKKERRPSIPNKYPLKKKKKWHGNEAFSYILKGKHIHARNSTSFIFI